MRAAALTLALLSAACAAPERVAPFAQAPRPTDAAFLSAVPAGGTTYGNDSLAALLARLVHETEWGVPVPRLSRFAGPIRVSLQGPGAAAYAGFLEDFLAQLRGATGIDIAPGLEPAQIHIHLVDLGQYKAVTATNSCHFVFGNVSWDQFRAALKTPAGVAQLQTEPPHAHATVFIPQASPPHLVRTCLIEEVVQSLGPVNDLWGLSSSIFNDDQVHIWPTALDLLLLRVLYQPELVPGQDRTATEAGARIALRRLHPQGEAAPPLPSLGGPERSAWRRLIYRSAAAKNITDLTEALTEAEAEIARVAPQSAEHCHTLAALGWDPDGRAALQWLDRAREVCALVHGAQDVRLAMLAYQRGLALLRLDRAQEALAEMTAALPPLMAHGNEQRIGQVLRDQAWVGRILDRPEAGAIWAQGRAWSAYSLGADNPVMETLRQRWDAGP